MSKNEKPKGCACTQNLKDMLIAATPPKNNLIRKTTCPDCGKVFWTNSDKDYCFDCQAKNKQS